MGLDAMISPVYPICSFKAEDAEVLGATADYCIIWNVLHYPAGVVPVT